MARADYQCGDQTDDCHCAAYDPYPCCSNGGNCTWWAWEAACCNWTVGLPGWGNANQWVGNASLDPNYEVLDYPVVGSIACRVSGTYGHVAWVTAVSGTDISVTEENCCAGCNYGMRSFDYAASHFDGGFIIRKDQCACKPGDPEQQECGNCGQQSRTCGTDCQWPAWGECSGEGVCAKSQTEAQPCGDCGTSTRTCNDTCQWDAFGECAGPDPDGGLEPCATGQQGECAQGTKRCVAGNLQCQPDKEPSAEVCDSLDNDCNGVVDDNDVCGAGAASTPGGVGVPSAEDTGGCGCRLSPPALPLGSALGGLVIGFGLGLRRATKRRRRRKT